jgi:hypothetical protein
MTKQNPNQIVTQGIVSNDWVELTPTNHLSPRSRAAMAYDPINRKTILFGGETDYPNYYGDTWAYDFYSNTWTNMNPSNAPSKRGGHSMVYDPELQAIVLFGGRDLYSSTSDTWAYDYSKNTWTNLNPPDSPDKRTNHAHVYDSFHKKHIIFGGGGSSDHDDTWEYDSMDNRWTQLFPTLSPPPYYNNVGSYDVANQKTIIYGGQSGASLSDSTWAFDYNTTTWINMGPATSPGKRIFHGMEYDPWSRKTIMFGGRLSTGQVVSDIWEYDFELNTWTDVSGSIAPQPRENMALSYDSFERTFILFGGKDPNYYYSDTWVSRPHLNSNYWMELNPITQPSSRRGAAMAYDPLHRKTILFGGETSSSIYNGETWAYDFYSNTWTNMNPSNAPEKRAGHSMVYDPELQAVILFGGFGAQNHADTWAYDYSKNTWTNLNPAYSPDARFQHAHVYDSFHKKHIVFGGGGLSSHDDTWEYDSSVNNWIQLFPSSNPPLYSDIAGSYDIANQKTILYGGQSGSGMNDFTWVFDYNTTTWTYMDPATSPGSRGSHAMEYDPWSQKTLVFGGKAGTGELLNDIWEYDFVLNTWTDITEPITPNLRENMAIAYDPIEQKFILFGGEDENVYPYLSDTWVLNGYTPVDLDPPSVSSPPDTTIEAGTTGNVITWDVDDILPDFYTITIDGIKVKTANWLAGKLVYDIGFLELGVHTINLTIFDSLGQNSFDMVQVAVFDTLAPIIDSPGDAVFEFGTTGNKIEWIVHDPNPDKYVIIDETTQEILDSGSWQDGETLAVDFNFDQLEARSIKLIINDTLAHETADTISVASLDRVPPSITGQENIEYEVFTLGNTIEWLVEDLLPFNYSITYAGNELESGNWTSGEKLVVDIDGLFLGLHFYQLTVWDTSGNNAEYSVTVEVVEPDILTSESTSESGTQTSKSKSEPGFELPFTNIPLLLIAIFTSVLIVRRYRR